MALGTDKDNECLQGILYAKDKKALCNKACQRMRTAPRAEKILGCYG
jgi:hypothetical protein